MSGEDAVRKYLLFLEDPAKVIDTSAVKKLERQIETTSDPIAKLKAYAELERLNSLDGSQFEHGFVHHARVWAETENIPVSAFTSMGVPESVLVSAGLLSPKRRSATRRSSSTRSGRARVVSAETVQEWVLATTEQFTLADVQRSVGGSPATIKKAVDELVRGGQVTKLGAIKDGSSRGRAPIRYERVR